MANTNTTLHFPQEITDIIVDFLHRDVQSLQACALVSRAWLPSCRFHLFRSYTINPGRLEGAFRIITTTPDVATYIEQLSLVGEKYRDFTVEELEVLLHALPHLRRLSLQNFIFGKTWATSPDAYGYYDLSGSNDDNPPQDQRWRQAGAFALEELQLLECDVVTLANYADLYRLLGMFSSIRALFLASNRTARRLFSERRDLPPPEWTRDPVSVAVEHLHTFDVPFSMLENILKALGTACALRTFWYDDNVLNWTERSALGGSAVDRFGQMVTSLNIASHQHLQCLILGPLPIFDDAFRIESGGLARLQLASIRDLQTFHLRGCCLEPHHAGVFSALPDTVREARFVVVGVGIRANRERARNRFREFALAFLGELGQRTHMTFVLDLGVAKRKRPEEFGVLKDKAEKGLIRLAALGRLRIDDCPKEQFG